MEKVTGRSDDMIILRGVNVFPTQIEEALLATEWCGGHFIIELTREGRMDQMAVLAESRPEHWDGSGLLAHAEKVTAFIKNTIGISAQVGIVAPDTLERSPGQGQACLRQAAKRVTPVSRNTEKLEIPVMLSAPNPLSVTAETKSVRLLAKAADAASMAPVVERRALSRAANEVLIEVKAAAVNPSDIKAATGLMPYAVFPRTSGRDYAGIVIDGPAGTIGREVFGSSGDLGIRRDGTHATHLAVEAEAVVEKPKNLSWEEAAGIGVPLCHGDGRFSARRAAEKGRDGAGDGRQRQGRASRDANRDLARRACDRRGTPG